MRTSKYRLHLEELERRDTPSMLAGPAAGLESSSTVQTETLTVLSMSGGPAAGLEPSAAALTVMAPKGQSTAPHGLGAAARALMPEQRGAFHDLVVRAWQDPQLRDELGAATRQFLPANPAGFLGAIDALLHPGPIPGGVPPPGTTGDPSDPDS